MIGTGQSERTEAGYIPKDVSREVERDKVGTPVELFPDYLAEVDLLFECRNGVLRCSLFSRRIA